MNILYSNWYKKVSGRYDPATRYIKIADIEIGGYDG
jgi:hypothetical protein